MSILAKDISKAIGDPATQVLSHISLEIKAGEFVSLTGRSGSGKSTLLYLLSSLDSPTAGSIEILGHDINKMESDDLHRFRNEQMGFVFQFHYLIAELTALENVLMPSMKYNKQNETKEYAKHLLSEFGLQEKLHRLPRQLSGGEQQRVAIARALAQKPRFLFADEPTGSLDSTNGEKVMNIIIDANKNMNTTIVLVTHEPEFAALAQRQIRLVDGKLAVP